MKYILLSIIVLAFIGCSEYSATGPVNPTFDPPVVNEIRITLENSQEAGILRFGPVLVPIVDPYEKSKTFVYPSIATDLITLTFSNEKTTSNLIYLVRANVNPYLSNELYFGSYLGISNSKFIYIIDNSVISAGIYNFNIVLNELPEGVYVLYLKDNNTGIINGEVAFFKTNESNRQRIYKNLKIAG